jgi:multiple sugar transport system substrate-binding protein
LNAYKGDLALNPRFAWEGKLVDVSDIIELVKAAHIPTALAAASFYNKAEKKQSYFAVLLWNMWKGSQNRLRSQDASFYKLWDTS